MVAVRTRLGGGSPNTINPLLSEWKALNETRQAEAMPPPPDPVETVTRQAWGTASQEAQGQKGSGFAPVIHSAPSQSAGLSLAFPSGLVLRGIAGDNLPLVYQLLSRLT